MKRLICKHIFGFIAIVLGLIVISDLIFDLPFLYHKKGTIINGSYKERKVKCTYSNSDQTAPFNAIFCYFSYRDKNGKIINVDHKSLENKTQPIEVSPFKFKTENKFIYKNTANSYLYNKLKRGIVYGKFIPNGAIILIILFFLLLQIFSSFELDDRSGDDLKKDLKSILLFLGYNEDNIYSFFEYIDKKYAWRIVCFNELYTVKEFKKYYNKLK